MDEIEMIATALAAGASAGLSNAATDAVKDGYTQLKALIRHRLTGREDARRELDADQTEAGVWRTRIGKDLLDSGAATDQRILEAAQQLLTAADPHQSAKINITAETITGGIFGEFHAPVNVDQRSQLPPPPPTAE